MEAKLVVVGGEAKTAEIKLKLPTVVGRGRDASLTLPHPLVSRQHCEIFDSDGKLFVRDLGSLNGTYVNNERIEGERELPSGVLLTIGTVTFRAVYEDQPDLLPPAAAAPMATPVNPQQATEVPPTAATVQVHPPQPAADDTASEVDQPNLDFNALDAQEVEFDQLPPGAAAEAGPNDDDALNSFLNDLE